MSEYGEPAITAATLRGGLDAVLGAVLDARPGLTREGRALARHAAARCPAYAQARAAVAALAAGRGAPDEHAAALAEAGQALHLLARSVETAADLLTTSPAPY